MAVPLKLCARLVAAIEDACPSPLVRSLRGLMVRELRRREENGFAPSVYGPRLRSNWSDSTFLMATTGAWGFKLHDLLADEDSDPFVFLDIGANFGTYSLVACQNSRCRGVHAIEPNPRVFADLIQNAEANGHAIDAHMVGIGPSNAEASLSFKETNLGRGSLVQKFDNAIPIAIRDHSLLDEIGKRHPEERFFVKVDVEGYEREVIRQLDLSTIRNRIDKVFIEINPAMISRQEIDEITQSLEGWGLTEAWRSTRHRNAQYDALFLRARERT